MLVTFMNNPLGTLSDEQAMQCIWFRAFVSLTLWHLPQNSDLQPAHVIAAQPSKSKYDCEQLGQ
jgi:hypothetical protein